MESYTIHRLAEKARGNEETENLRGEGRIVHGAGCPGCRRSQRRDHGGEQRRPVSPVEKRGRLPASQKGKGQD